jgi:hypothetical protein
LKSLKALFSSQTPSVSSLSPSSYYLRLLIQPGVQPPELNDFSWRDPSIAALLLEWRAARMVYEHAQTSTEPDATVSQRVSKAVTEAFIASQVLEILKNLSLPDESGKAVGTLYLLASSLHLPSEGTRLNFRHSICLRRLRRGLWIFSPLVSSVPPRTRTPPAPVTLHVLFG